MREVGKAAISAAFALTACDALPDYDGFGTAMSQDEIRDEIIGKQIRMTQESGPAYVMTLRQDNVISVLSPSDSGTWNMAETGTDICMRFALYARGDTGCFGLIRLPEAGQYATDHGRLITILEQG